MSHLSSQEISRYLVGDLPAELETHAQVCRQCEERLTRLESSLSHFRSSVRNLKDTHHMTTRMYSGNETMAGLTSLLIHSAIIVMILLLGTLKPRAKDDERIRNSNCS